jgi:hypothetical protein
MNGFMKTLIYGFAALGVLISTAMVTTLMQLRGNGTLTAQHLRPLILSEEEREWLKKMHLREEEPADVPQAPPTNESEMLTHIAEMAGASHANQFLLKLRRQQQALDERQTFLDQQWADVQLAKAGLERLQRHVQELQRQSEENGKTQAEEQARWAQAQASEAQRMQVFAEVEKLRYAEQAKLFEQMKDNAWQSLRRFPPSEIARYLALMDNKKAARMLVLAQDDADYPNVAVEINQEMLRLDVNAASGDQIKRMATLYSFMPPAKVLPYLEKSSAEDIAGLMIAMASTAPLNKQAALMEALRQKDSILEMKVRTLVEKRTSTTAAATP